tara:strand:- start:358 stop:624 length:267 start_codon:yes stop_codon:yes gene_type:complete
MVMSYRNKFNLKHKQPKDASNSIAKIARLSGIKRSILDKVFLRGKGAYKSNPKSVRPSVSSPEQWGYGRIYSVVMGGKARQSDADLFK